MPVHARRRRRRPGVALLVPVALLASSAVVYQASNAAFTDTTDNAANAWAAGTVTLTDDDSGSAVVNLSGLKPGDSQTKCLNVTYGGDLAAAVKLYAGAYSDSGLAQYLTFSIDEGTSAAGGASLSCSGFALGATLYTGTLAGFAAGGSASTDFATGVSSWTPTGTQTRSYRFSWTLQDNNAAQGTSASATFTWEAQNT